MTANRFERATAAAGGQRTAVDLAQICEQVVDESEHDRATLARLREDLDFEVGFFVRDDTIESGGSLGLRDDVVVTTRRRIAGYGRELAPVLQAAVDGGLAVDREVMGARLESTRLYREFMAPHGGHSTVLLPLTFRHCTYGLLALGRRKRGFTGGEISWLADLAPVLRMCEASRGQTAPGFALTVRERDVLDYLCLGYSNREIASACETSINTVRNQLQSVYRKLGASTRAEAVGIALRRAGR